MSDTGGGVGGWGGKSMNEGTHQRDSVTKEKEM